MARILAIDYGGKRTGLAVTDPLGIFATGLETVPTKELMDYLVNYHATEGIEKLVVGVPYRLDGSLSAIAKEIKAFLDRFNKRFPSIEIIGIDESGTSIEAVQSMVHGGMKKKDRRKKENIDKVSATLILQRYLAENTI